MQLSGLQTNSEFHTLQTQISTQCHVWMLLHQKEKWIRVHTTLKFQLQFHRTNLELMKQNNKDYIHAQA